MPAQTSSQSAPKPSAESQRDDSLAAAARELARKVASSGGAAIQGKLSVAPSPVNLSSVPSFEFQKACNVFRDEIEQQTNASYAGGSQEIEPASVSITLADNLRGFLWIAQVTQGLARQTFFVPVPGEIVAQANQLGPSVILQKEFLLSEPDRILDVDLLFTQQGASPQLLVLQPERIVLFAQQNGAWHLQSQTPIGHSSPWPRDLRGRLQPGTDGEEAVLPGVTCTVSTSNALSVSCKSAGTGWLFSLGFPRAFTFLPTAVASGNTFTFPVLGSQQFYSLAVIAPPASSGASVPLIATSPDGRAILSDGSATPVASFPNWGSDVAALYSPSRALWPLLTTHTGDWTVPDSIQAFDIIDGQAAPVSSELSFDGPITALWSESENTALAVSRNVKTGMYEAYFIRAVYSQ